VKRQIPDSKGLEFKSGLPAKIVSPRWGLFWGGIFSGGLHTPATLFDPSGVFLNKLPATSFRLPVKMDSPARLRRIENAGLKIEKLNYFFAIQEIGEVIKQI